MRFPLYFKRGLAVATLADVGSDTAPTVSTGHGGVTKDNVFSHKFSRPINRVAVGYWYEGGGSAVALPVAIYVWDDSSQKWYRADAGTLTNGQLTFLKVPYLGDPPQVGATGAPQHGIDVMIVVSNNMAPDGTYHLVAGPDAANF